MTPIRLESRSVDSRAVTIASKGTARQIHHGTTQRDDRGFTLVELLIVIVILGILATVTVFAVRDITDRGQENSEATDLDTLETAISAYWMEERSNPTEQQLLDDGYLTELSDLHDIAIAADGSYTITNVRTGAVVSNGAASGGAPAAPASAWLGTPTTVGTLPAVSYGNPTGSTQVLWDLDSSERASRNAAVTANNGLNSNTDNFVVVDTASITTQAAADALVAAAATYQGREFRAADIPVNYGGARTLQAYLGMSGASFGMGSTPVTFTFN